MIKEKWFCCITLNSITHCYASMWGRNRTCLFLSQVLFLLPAKPEQHCSEELGMVDVYLEVSSGSADTGEVTGMLWSTSLGAFTGTGSTRISKYPAALWSVCGIYDQLGKTNSDSSHSSSKCKS